MAVSTAREGPIKLCSTKALGHLRLVRSTDHRKIHIGFKTTAGLLNKKSL
jgi:hypothetical protein